MWYWFFRAIFIVVLRLFFRFKIEGVENLPSQTNFIVVANHTSLLDTLAVGSLPRRIYWVAERWLYRVPGVQWFLKKINTFSTGGAAERAEDLLVHNKNVGIFPEGKCSLDGKLCAFRRGAAMLALKTGRPVVPCAILGAYEALPWGAALPTFHRVRLKVGKPVSFIKEFGEQIDDVYMQEGIEKVRRRIQEMLDAG